MEQAKLLCVCGDWLYLITSLNNNLHVFDHWWWDENGNSANEFYIETQYMTLHPGRMGKFCKDYANAFIHLYKQEEIERVKRLIKSVKLDHLKV